MASVRWLRAMMPVLLLGGVATLAGPHCAKGPCAINSDCGPRRYCDPDQQCRSDCLEDRDCADGYCDLNGRCQSGPRPDAGTPDVPTVKDASDEVDDAQVTPDVPLRPDVPVAMDRVTPPVDIPTPPVDVVFPDIVTPVDVVFPDIVTPDAGTPGRYLDPCRSGGDCASRDCTGAAGAPQFCTKPCASSSECGAGFICARAHCIVDDTGLPCMVSAPDTCGLYCYSSSDPEVPHTPSTRAHCTHECRTGSDCPAGFACQDATATVRVCVESERPCARGSECATSLCLGGVSGTTFRGCTSYCNTASDCPQRAPIANPSGGVDALPPYTCEMVGGYRICVPPLAIPRYNGDIIGSDALGTACSTSASTVNCRSGLCAPVRGGMCIQTCTVAGGCPTGFGCDADFDTSSAPITLFCVPIGTRALGESCSDPTDCASGSCHPRGFCTRICNDGFCPTGMTCGRAGTSTDGVSISLCVR